MSLEDKWMIAQMNKQLYEAYCKLEQRQKEMVELEKTIGELRRELEDLKWKEVRFEETTGRVTAAQSTTRSCFSIRVRSGEVFRE